jgi:hypothetical protein
MRIIEELLERKPSGSGLENRDQRPCGPVALTPQQPLPQKSALASSTPEVLGRYSSLADYNPRSLFFVYKLFRCHKKLYFVNCANAGRSGDSFEGSRLPSPRCVRLAANLCYPERAPLRWRHILIGFSLLIKARGRCYTFVVAAKSKWRKIGQEWWDEVRRRWNLFLT